MGDVCERHRHLDPSYGSCAPLHAPGPDARTVELIGVRDGLRRMEAQFRLAADLTQAAIKARTVLGDAALSDANARSAEAIVRRLARELA